MIHDAVLLHGQPGGPLDWVAVRRELPDDLRPFVPDRPGYGHNPAPPAGLADNADDILRQLDALEIERVVVAGHSWGGGVAIAMAERYPDRVRGLVLIASIGPHCLVPLDHLLGAPMLGEALSYISLHLAGPFIRRRIRRSAAGTLSDADRLAVEEHFLANRRRRLWRTFLVEQRAMLRELDILDGALASLTLPTIVLAGTADKIVPPRTARALAEAIPGAELRMVNGANHYLPRHRGDVVARAICDVAKAACDSHA